MATDPLSLDEVLAQYDAGNAPALPEAGDILTDGIGETPEDPDQTGQVKGKAQSAVAGAFDALSFGFLDEAGAVADTLVGAPGRKTVWSSGRSFAATYRENRDLNRAALKEAATENPNSYLGGQIVGALVVPFARLRASDN